MLPKLGSSTPFYAPYILRGRQRWLMGKGESLEPGVFRLIAVLDGVYSITTSAGDISVTTGDVCLMEPAIDLSGSISSGGHALLIVFATDPRFLKPTNKRGRYKTSNRSVVHPTPQALWGCTIPTLLDRCLDPQLMPAIRWMTNAWWRDDWHHYLANQCLARSLEQIARHYRIQEVHDRHQGESLEQQIVLQTQRLIDQHIESYHSTAALAAQLDMTSDALRTVFTKHTGQTPADAIKHRRIAMIQDFLGNTSLTMEAVGKRLGFRSSSAFSQYCQRHLGCSPTHWKRQHRLGVEG